MTVREPAGVRGSVRVWSAGRPVDLAATLGPLRHGSGDPTFRTVGGAVWRTARTPEGVATQRISVSAAAVGSSVQALAWGPGAGWLLETLPDLLGARDDPTGFRPEHPLIADGWRRSPGWRVPRTQLVLEALVPAVLEQKVTGREAWASWRRLVTAYGTPAPGPAPAGMAVAPEADVWAAVPSWQWHRAGVGPDRSRTIVGLARRAAAIERTVGLAPVEVDRRLRSLPGVGAWTSAEVRQRAHGDPDAVSVGDFHLASLVVYNLTGESGGDDARMLELLAPYAGHRYRAVRMVELTGVAPQRRAPRYSPLDHRRR
jgi:3-methyladenine DNA glycosylase/8-oxoguanine DNA glycosylase